MNKDLYGYKVVLTKDAVKDIDEIYNYIAYTLCAPVAAKKLCSKIRKAILSLEYYPKKYASLNIQINSMSELRRVPVDNYLIVYTIIDSNVYVLNVFYGASDFMTKLSK